MLGGREYVRYSMSTIRGVAMTTPRHSHESTGQPNEAVFKMIIYHCFTLVPFGPMGASGASRLWLATKDLKMMSPLVGVGVCLNGLTGEAQKG